MLDELRKKGIRVALDAESLVGQLSPAQVEQLTALKKPFISKEDVKAILQESTKQPKVEVRTSSKFKPLAKEYEANIQVHSTLDVTGKARIKGETQDFVKHFQDRYKKLAKILAGLRSKYPLTNIGDLKRHINEHVRIIGMVFEKRATKKGNLLLELEDLTGRYRIIISNNVRNEKLFKQAQDVVLDDVIAIGGKVLEPYIIANEMEWPEIPITKDRKQSENDLAAVYISDTHFGSRYFLHNYMDKFVEWINGKGEARELAGKVKYVIVAGDIADGVGVYPNHIQELAVPDIYKQYALFDDFVGKLPDYIKIIVVPGNHDAVRRAEPMPAITKDFIQSDVISLGNPASVTIEQLKHVLYHGNSLDSLIAHLSNASYTHPERVMVEYLRRRHLSPIYGGNLIVPQHTDYLVLKEEPDVIHCGHVHKNGYGLYRNTLLINSGTFQDRTQFQIRQGHIPTPGLVPVYELKHARLRTLDFR